MGVIKGAAVGVVIGLVLGGCATLAFPYRYYGLDAVSYDGTLLGPKPADDHSLKECQDVPASPTSPAKKGQCIVMFRDQFLQLKADFRKMQIDLSACQGKTASI